MTPVKQTPGKGNCLQAAVASVLDVGLEAVPDFSTDLDGKDNKNWWKELVGWSKGVWGKGLVRFNLDGAWNDLPEMHGIHAIVVGKTSRPGANDDHAVVCKVDTDKDGEVRFTFVHDPNETESYINTLKYAFFFV